jgi:hypothetical protein
MALVQMAISVSPQMATIYPFLPTVNIVSAKSHNLNIVGGVLE